MSKEKEVKEKKSRSSIGKNNRAKGHNYERDIALKLRTFYPHIATTRAQSKLMDDCLIDLCNCPFNIQAKNGYEKARPKYEKLYLEIASRMDKLIPKGHMLEGIKNNPFLLFHKIGGKAEENTVTMKAETFYKLLEMIHNNKIDEDIDTLEEDINVDTSNTNKQSTPISQE
jgi:hypothetical protein